MHRLELAGAPRLRSDAGAQPLAPRDALLLCWLALEGPTPRTRLARLLWPASDDVAARNALRQRLFHIRKQAGTDLIAGTDTLRLAEGVTHDLGEADEVLSGIAASAADGELALWLALQRDRRRSRVRQSLAELADLAERAGDWADAMNHAREMLALEPLSESAHRRLIRLHYLAGDRAAALLAFDRCEQLLKDEIGARPSAETLDLLAAVERAALPVPTSTAPSLLRPPRLVGRDADWVALGEAVANGQGVLVVGEAGLGKSRLVGDFARQMARAAVLVGARASDAAAPYATLVRLLRMLMQRIGEPPKALRRHLARLMPELGDPGPAPPDADRLQAALQSYMAGAAQAGVHCVVVEDLHDADAASAESLRLLADTVQTLAWVFSSRPVEGATLSWPEARRIVLAPLDTVHLTELIDSLALPGRSGAALAPRLLQHTGGNPLFVLETLKTMQDGAVLPAASSVTRLVSQRLGRLSSQAVRVARCAALAGPEFSVELATHLLGVGPLDLADAWAELEAAHVLHDQSFAHDLVREAARSTVPAPLARELHRQIAEFLEARGAPPDRLAAHWRASGSPQRAVPHLLSAGRRAIDMLRWGEAADLLLEAADLLDAADGGDAAFDAVDGFFAAVRLPQEVAERVCARLDLLARTPIQRGKAAEHRAGMLTQRGDFDAAATLAHAALAGFRHDQAPVLAAMLMLHSLGGHLQRGDHDASLRTAHRIVALTEPGDDAQAKQQAVAALATALHSAGRNAEAEPHFVRALEIAKQRGDPLNIVESALELATLNQATGDIVAARRAFDLVEQLTSRHELDADALWPWMALQRTRLALQQADYRSAVEGLEHARAVLAQRMPSWAIALDNVETRLWMRLGQWARARQASQAAQAHGQGALPLYVAQARAMAVELDLNAGRHPHALAALDRALGELGDGSPRAALQITLGRSRLLDAAEGLELAQRCGREARSRGLLGQALDAEVCASELALRAGHAVAACRHAQSALSLFETVEPTDLYRARVWLAAVQALGDTEVEEARRILKLAVHWVRDTAERHVPPAHRDSFLHHNPVNQGLLALAASLR